MHRLKQVELGIDAERKSAKSFKLAQMAVGVTCLSRAAVHFFLQFARLRLVRVLQSTSIFISDLTLRVDARPFAIVVHPSTMVSFQCDGCQDVVKKPKLDNHYQKCYSSFTCVDCSTTFNTPKEYKGHTSCITEAEKYQKSLYDAGKGKGKKNANSSAAPHPVKTDVASRTGEQEVSENSTKDVLTSEVNRITRPNLDGTNGANPVPNGRANLGSGRGRGRPLDNMSNAQHMGSGFIGRGGGRGGAGWGAPSFSRFRARNLGTGANDTPLGTPIRSFASSPSPSGISPITTPLNGTPGPIDGSQEQKAHKKEKKKSKLHDASMNVIPNDEASTSLKSPPDKLDETKVRKEKKKEKKRGPEVFADCDEAAAEKAEVTIKASDVTDAESGKKRKNKQKTRSDNVSVAESSPTLLSKNENTSAPSNGFIEGVNLPSKKEKGKHKSVKNAERTKTIVDDSDVSAKEGKAKKRKRDESTAAKYEESVAVVESDNKPRKDKTKKKRKLAIDS